MPVFDPIVVDAGKLRNRVTIQAPSTSRDGYGQRSQTWSDLLVTYASIVAISLREMLQANQLASQVTHTITIRYPGPLIRIIAGQRVVTPTTTYTIQAVDDVEEQHRVIRLQCVAIGEAV